MAGRQSMTRGGASVMLLALVLFLVAGAAAEPIHVQGDRIDYDRTTGQATVTGHAVVTRGTEKLTADRVRVNTYTGDAEAVGQVRLERLGTVWRGERLDYNFHTGQGSADGFEGEAAPFRWTADRVERTAEAVFILHNADITTCNLSKDHRHYHIRARTVRVKPGEHIVARHAVWYFGSVPSFYTPYWRRNLQDDGTGWRFRPGYQTRYGAFLLSSYGWRIAPWLMARTHLDYRTERGFAFGQDLAWRSEGYGGGSLQGYYIADRRPLDDGEDPAVADIDSERYRARLRHTYYGTARDTMFLQLDLVSDGDLLEDFYEREYREARQPVSYLVYTRRGRSYAASATVRMRLNDFYTVTERLPEVSYDLMRQELGGSGLYYESRSALGYLRMRWRDDLPNDDYEAMRIDTDHRVYYPTKLFGFLSLVPRAGYRGTGYTETPEGGDAQGDPVWRSIFELGQAMSFKAFRVWLGSGDGTRAWRHVVEPYADYRLVSKPDRLPGDLFQFDSVDGLNRAHYLKFGVRNTLQRRRGRRASRLADLNVYTFYVWERDRDTEPIEDVFAALEVRPSAWLRVNVDARHNLPEDTLRELNSRLYLRYAPAWAFAVEQRHRPDLNDFWKGHVTWAPNPGWTLDAYAQADFETDRFEEAGGGIRRTVDCLSFRLGGRVLPRYDQTDGTVRESEWRIMLEFNLTAFPGVRFGL